MPRFVLLRHELPSGAARPTHFDFMLDAGGALRTWALAQPPESGVPMAAEPLPDHRREYLDYVGPVSDDRGAVTQWDAGDCEWLRSTDDDLLVEIAGRWLQGRVRLARTTAGGWTLEYETT